MGNFKDFYQMKIFVIFKMYNGIIMIFFGKCIFKCVKGEMSRDVDFFIIDEGVRFLLGVEICQELNLIRVMISDILELEIVNVVNK